MSPFVYPKIFSHTKGFITQIAAVRLLFYLWGNTLIGTIWHTLACFSMSIPVSIKISKLTETSATLFTDKRLFSCVFSQMLFEVSAFTEALATMIALIRFLSCMYSHVFAKIPRPSKQLSTIITRDDFLSQMHLSMHKEISFHCKLHVTDITGKRPLTSMNFFFMLLEMM